MLDKKKQLQELLAYIPSGAQTLSKNPTQYAVGVSPLLISRAAGVYVFDQEDKSYLDMVMALGAAIFGYARPEIDEAVKAQIDRGVIYSLPAPQELALAKILREVVPNAEMSRFVLNGNDATSGAIRLARHITGRNHVAKCGYHGWQDWSIGTKDGRNHGVPAEVKNLTHDFIYNDIDSLAKIFAAHPGQIAAVILEPVSVEKPQVDFLAQVRDLAKKNGALLIFDELVTGFRWALGGAQEYFGIIPDLACFGKALANGYPLATICGRAEYMKKMDEVFVSMTAAGFIPGLVAAMETIKMMRELGDVHEKIHALGDCLIREGNRLARENFLPIEFVGYGPHPVMKINISDDYQNRAVKTFIYQIMHEAGILFSSSMMISYQHQQSEIDAVAAKLSEIFLRLREIVGHEQDWRKILPHLKSEVVAPRSVRLIQ